jgi:hypothetical protein
MRCYYVEIAVNRRHDIAVGQDQPELQRPFSGCRDQIKPLHLVRYIQ